MCAERRHNDASCWLPDHMSVGTPIVQPGNTVFLGAHGGQVITVDLSHFELPEV